MNFGWEWSVQTILQLVTLIGVGWAGVRWVVRHYLKDMLAEQQQQTAATAQIHEQVHEDSGGTLADHVNDTNARVQKLETAVAVLLDRSERKDP
jgi:hypothetical protein